MHVWRRIFCVVLAAFAAPMGASTSASAEPIQIKPSLLRLNANLELSPGKTEAHGAVILVHDTLSHHGEPTIVALQESLKRRGLSTLAITLSLGVDDRQGPRACDVAHDYALAGVRRELILWIAWLKAQGAQTIDIVGFSRGGAQVAAVARELPELRRVVLVAPAFASAGEIAETYRRTYGKELQPLLDAARAAPLQKTVVDFLVCRQAPVLGAAFLDGYREFPAQLAGETGKPTLVILAGQDEVVPDLAQKLPTDTRRVTIDKAAHAFAEHHADEAAEAIAGFLTEQ